MRQRLTRGGTVNSSTALRTLQNFSISVQLSRFLLAFVAVASKECIAMSVEKYLEKISATRKPFEKSLRTVGQRCQLDDSQKWRPRRASGTPPRVLNRVGQVQRQKPTKEVPLKPGCHTAEPTTSVLASRAEGVCFSAFVARCLPCRGPADRSGQLGGSGWVGPGYECG